MPVTHIIERTSPKGEKFVGRCINCGKIELTIGDALKTCENPKGLTADEAIILAIEDEGEGLVNLKKRD